MQKMAVLLISGVVTIVLTYLLVFPSLAAQRVTVSGEALSPLSKSGEADVKPVETELPVLVSRPITLKIDKLGIEADVETVGMDSQGRMDVPKLDGNVAWYELGVKPGELGSAVVAGHFDSSTGLPAVFYELDSLVVGDEITIIDEVGRSQVFKVREKALYLDSEFPISDVFGRSDGRWLNLITCAGDFDQTAKNYSERRVVFAELIE